MSISARQSAVILISLFRGCRVFLHVCYGLLLAIVYPHLNQAGQNRILKRWNRQLLSMFNIDILVQGQPPRHPKGGILIVANHVSWLDIIVLNAIHPSRFIAKSEVNDWPVIGWLTRRCGTVFIERSLRQNTSIVNRRISELFGQDISIGLFPEGTTTDGKQVAPFRSALIQPAIDAGIWIQPMALRYREKDGDGEPGSAAVFVGDMTLALSIWRILRCPRQHALVIFTPALSAENADRRVLARAAQTAISRALQSFNNSHPTAMQPEVSAVPESVLPSLSAYEFLVDPMLNQLPVEDS
ncbi:MAG: lysophospholipid acyltransferase family protein [Gallionella sp.]